MDVESKVPSLESVHVMSEFSEFFPNDLLSITSQWEIKFGIDIFPDAQPISILPHRMDST